MGAARDAKVTEPLIPRAEVPPKIRELIAELERNGFKNRGGKGSHRNFEHPLGVRLTISGNLGDDAKLYQERAVRKMLNSVQGK